jgi:uncharacterized membrane protein YdjX (TVP38/TMEM64 family)
MERETAVFLAPFERRPGGDLETRDMSIDAPSEPPEPRRLHPATLAVPLLMAVLCVFAWRHRDQLGPAYDAAKTWTASQGVWGVVVFGVVYAAAIILFIPGNMLTALATALFGPLVAIVVVSLGGTAGATIAFLIARHGARDYVAQRLRRYPRFRWIEEQTETRGSLFVAIARILPLMPGNLLHYAFGLTRVSLGTFIFWSYLGSMPALILFATGLDAVLQVFTGHPVPWPQVAAFAGLVCVKVALIAWAAHQAGVPLRRRR